MFPVSLRYFRPAFEQHGLLKLSREGVKRFWTNHTHPPPPPTPLNHGVGAHTSAKRCDDIFIVFAAHLSKHLPQTGQTLLLQQKTTQIDKKEKQQVSERQHYGDRVAEVMRVMSAERQEQQAAGRRSVSHLYLNEGCVAPALLLVDVQPQLLAHLADLGSVLSEVGSRRLAPLSLLHISRQVVEQL